MFNLDQTILEWRRQMLTAGIKAPVPLDELESHLRDEIEQQTSSGVSEAQAFSDAVKNLGPAPALQAEFKKAGGTKEEREQREEQILFEGGPILLTLFSFGQVFVVFKNENMGLTFAQQISCLAAIATMLFLTWGGRVGYRLFPVIPAKRVRNAINYSGFSLVALWWIVFFYVVLPSHDFDAKMFLVTFFWGFQTPLGAWAGVVCGIEYAARKNVVAG